jgi:hypothetical protein
MSPEYTVSIERGIRGLLLGRVYLKADMKAGDTEIPVGDEFTSQPGCSLPGANLFYNYSTDATLVQPAVTDAPGDIEYQEDVDLVQGLPNDLHAVADAGVDHSYTVARGAYLRLRTLPAVCSKLVFVEGDFADALEPQFPDDKFPAALVFQYGSSSSSYSSTQFEETLRFIVRYGVIMRPGWRDQLRADMEELSTLLRQDNYLGGTCIWSEMTKPMELNPTPGRNQQGLVRTTLDQRIDWGDVYLTATRWVVVDKTVGA